jgi:hypothetical protein
LIRQEKVAKFCGEDVVINMNLLRKYLLSSDSIFEIQTLEDFLESLHILGFYRSCLPEVEEETHHLCYRFVNPLFVAGEPVRDDLYKRLADPGSPAMKHTKRMMSTSSLQLLQKLMRKKTCSDLRISQVEFAQLRLDFALQSQLDLSRNDSSPDITEFSLDEPDYTKNNEIAGYYGNVTIEALTEGFQNYFPMFQDPASADDVSTTPEDPALSNDGPMVSEEVQVIQSEEPKKKKRKYTKKSREELKETEEALMFLQKETMVNAMEE